MEWKFRAWDNKFKRMIVWDDLKTLSLNSMTMMFDWDWVFMPYTGVKDSEGREIYDGDILELNDMTYEIVFLVGDYQVGFKKKSGNSLTDIGEETSNRLKIIGNKFEGVSNG